MADTPFDSLVLLFKGLQGLSVFLAGFLVQWLLLIVWIAWWLWGVNWNKVWPILNRGGWIPLGLLTVVAALVWSQIAPATGTLFGQTDLPNFWWQLGNVILIVGLALFCGWVQGSLGWTPADISLEPPAAPAHGHNGVAHH